MFPPKEVFAGITIYRALGTGFGKRSFLHRVVDAFTLQWAMLWKLFRLPRNDYVIAFTSPPLVSFIAAVHCRLFRAKLISWLMDVNPDAAIEVGYLKRGSWISLVLLSVFRWTLKASNTVVVLDRWMRDRIIAKGVDAERVVVIPPWDIQEPEVFEKAELLGSENPFTLTHGLGGKFVVLYSGNLSIVHPLDTILAAATRLKNDSAVQFLFVGGGLRSQDVSRAKEAHGLENVVQLPYQSRATLPFSLSCASVHVIVLGDRASGLVHTSKVYGTLMAGKPFIAVAPAESHLADLVGEVPGAFRVDHGDIEGFLVALEVCRGFSRDQLTTIRATQRKYLLKNFALNDLLGRFEATALLVEVSEGRGKLANPMTRC